MYSLNIHVRIFDNSYYTKFSNKKTLFTFTYDLYYSWPALVIFFFLLTGVGFELNSDEYRYVGIQIHYARPLQGTFLYVTYLPT